MSSEKMTARVVGVLYIIAIVATILSFVYLESLGSPDVLVNVPANERQIMIGVLLELIVVLTIVGIPVMLFPILKKHNEALALGFLGFKFVEAISTIFVSISLLSLLTLGQEYAKAGAPAASYYLTLGTLLIAAREGAIIIGLGLFYALSVLILNYVLVRSRLVPRWLSGWGLVGAILSFSNTLLQLFSIDLGLLLFFPLRLQEMAFAVWLIVKGFNLSTIASLSAKTGGNER
jgi:hypothetical protein